MSAITNNWQDPSNQLDDDNDRSDEIYEIDYFKQSKTPMPVYSQEEKEDHSRIMITD